MGLGLISVRAVIDRTTGGRVQRREDGIRQSPEGHQQLDIQAEEELAKKTKEWLER